MTSQERKKRDRGLTQQFLANAHRKPEKGDEITVVDHGEFRTYRWLASHQRWKCISQGLNCPVRVITTALEAKGGQV